MMVVPKGNHHTHTDDSTNKAGEETDQHRIWSEREDDRNIQSRLCILDQSLRSALECRDDFSKDNSNAGEDDEDASREGCGEHDQVDHKVLSARELALNVGRSCEQANDEVNDSHRQGNHNRGVTQEAKALREVQVLR